MDTRTVVSLAGKAVESVLVFRANAFNPKAFIDVKNIRAATASAIRAFRKQPGYSGEIPLVNVVEVVGNAVSSATDKWNKVADPKNHINREWLRNCVCDLVSGAVSHTAFEENRRMHAEASKNEEQEEEYMDPMGSPYEDISHDTINTVIQKPAYALSIDGHAYYGLAEVLPDAENNILDHDVAVLPHYQVDQAWAAVNNGEAALSARGIHHKPAYTTCDLLEHNVDVHASTNKRPAPLTISGDSDVSEVEIVQPKRRHNPKQAAPEPSPAMVPVEEADNEEIIDEQIRKSQRKTSNKTPWTRPESELLVARRDSGKTWDEVHVSFANRTKAAIIYKYRILKDGTTSSRNTPDEKDDGVPSSPQPKKRRGDNTVCRGSGIAAGSG